MIVGLVTLQGVIGVLNGILVIVGSLEADRLDDDNSQWQHGYICICHCMGIFLGYNSILCPVFIIVLSICMYTYIYIHDICMYVFIMFSYPTIRQSDQEMMNYGWCNFPV